MYDRDLRAWYRDLFLYPLPRRSLRRRSTLRDACALRPRATERSAYEGLPIASDIPELSDYERPQASH
jgi:hypothetical protein